MKKSLLALALLVAFMGGNSYALNCAVGVDPTNGPVLCTETVYNNSASAISQYDLVVWDIASSAGDNDNWINTTTTADTGIVAGVALEAIPAGEIGTIVVRGPTSVNMATGAYLTANGSFCSSTTAGKAIPCATANSSARAGFSVGNTLLGVTKVFVETSR